MDLQRKEFTIEIGGKTLKLETSILAEQANGAVLGTYGDTAVLVTAVMGKKDRTGIDYFPLTVDYEEKFYAAGKIIGSRFIRREGRPSEEAILNGRLVDRSIRPLFDHRIRRDVQVVVTVLAIDEENDPDFVGLICASAALAISDIPWNGPIAGARMSKMNGETIINPTHKQRDVSILDVFVSGTKDRINMIEAGAKEIGEDGFVSVVKAAHEEIKKLVEFQERMAKEIGSKKTTVGLKEIKPGLVSAVRDFAKTKLEEAVYADKKSRTDKLDALKEGLAHHLAEKEFNEEDKKESFRILDEEISQLVHRNIIEHERRPDGRKLDEVRPIHAAAGLLKRTHGSGLFIRGNTQALSITTLAAPGQEQMVETMEITTKKRFLHHYNFPPYSVGETGFFRGPGRREIGHGALAGRALQPLIPDTKDFPYTIRVVSETLSSNGSSSMASVCAGSLSLMDAGVPIKKPVAGIAMGLMSETGQYKILTDIQGPEDHYGDMDLKVAGTRDGITAAQMDVKIEGLTPEMLEEALVQAKKARLEILEKITAVLPAPRPELSPYAPRVIVLFINPDKIREVIGPGGKVINEIIAKTQTTIDIEQDGQVYVTGTDEKMVGQAINWIKDIAREFQVGEVVEGTIVRVMDFGAILQISPRHDGMIHVSEIAPRHVSRVEEFLRVGDTAKAKIVKIDPETNRISLSTKQFH